MIAQFPQMYPDELFYSVLARYYVRSGHMTYRYCSEELFKNFRTPDIEYVIGISDELKRLVDLLDVIMNHTLFPVNARFITIERRRKAWDALLKGTSDYQNALYRRRGSGDEKRFLRFCPCCVREDREQLGEAYWHRKHQIPGINVCPEHGCYLCESSVEISSEVSPDLVPAEIEIAEKENPEKCRSETEIALAKYCGDVLFQPLNMDAQMDHGRFFRHKVQGTPYTSIRGQNINTQKLQNDLREYYGGVSFFAFEELTRVQKVFTTYNNPVAICSLALFLHIPVSEMTEMKTPEALHHEEYDLRIKQLHDEGMNYRQISESVGGSYDYVKLIGGRLEEKKKKKHSFGGKKTRDYSQMDERYYPEVERIINEMFDGSKQPQKVSISRIEKKLGLKNKTIAHLPRCMILIGSLMETPEQFWIREMVWMYEALEAEGAVVTISNLAIHPFNLSKQDLLRIYKYLKEEVQTEKKIKNLIAKTYDRS